MKFVRQPALTAENIVLRAISLVGGAEPICVAPRPTNHILVVDCSGSMDSQLPLIRAQLKNKLPHLAKEGDTVSLVWFSGRGQCGCLAEKVKMSSPLDLQRLNQAIDQWLKPVTLTAFVEPLREVLRVCAGSGGDFVNSLFFLTDGADNQWPEKEIVAAVRSLRDVLASAVFVEYGWRCNRELIAKMAEAVGGAHIFCEDFDAYQAVVSESFSRTGCERRVEVEVGDPLHGLVFSVAPDGPRTYQIEGGKVLVPEDVGAVYYFGRPTPEKETSSPVGPDYDVFSDDYVAAGAIADVSTPQLLAPVYLGAALLAQRLKVSDATSLLAGLGDVKLFRLYANCFGKQNLSDFQAAAIAAARGKMFEEGRSKNLAADPDAFTLLELLHLLAGDPENLFVPSAMEYKRISRATQDATEELTFAERAEIADITAKAQTEAERNAAEERVAAILAAKPKRLAFRYEGASEVPMLGYPIANLTWNETRANVSLLVKCPGVVELPPDAPAVLPRQFLTFVWRNYTIIRDGIANIAKLPVYLSRATFQALKAPGVLTGDWEKSRVYMIDLRALPTINRSMVEIVSAPVLFEVECELLKCKAAEKVYKAFKEKWAGKRASEGFKIVYGPEAADWLARQGITDYSGFNPKRKMAEPTDFYMGLELEVSIEGLATLPSYNEFAKKLGKKMTPREAILKPTHDQCEAFERAHPGEEERRDWIEEMSRESAEQARQLTRCLAELKFAIVVGKAWPREFSALGEGTLVVELNGAPRKCKLELREVEIKV